jgi:arylsulfatase
MAQSTTGKKPNILILWGDDIGYWNISHYSKGMMGYSDPNIDRVQRRATFTDWVRPAKARPDAPPHYRPEPDPHGLTKVGMPAPRSPSERRSGPLPNC